MAQAPSDYRIALEQCLANADKSPGEEIRALWLTVADGYRFLLSLADGSYGADSRLGGGDDTNL